MLPKTKIARKHVKVSLLHAKGIREVKNKIKVRAKQQRKKKKVAQ